MKSRNGSHRGHETEKLHDKPKSLSNATSLTTHPSDVASSATLTAAAAADPAFAEDVVGSESSTSTQVEYTQLDAVPVL
jgi:hypothetical protein